MSLRTILLQTKRKAEEESAKHKTDENAVVTLLPKRKKRRQDNPEDKELRRLQACHKSSGELLFTKLGTLMPASRDERAAGLFMRKLPKKTFKVLQDFYENTIKTSIPAMIEWGEGKADPRRRGYACLEVAGGVNRLVKSGIQMNHQGTYGPSATNLHRKTLAKCCCIIGTEKVDEGVWVCLDELCTYVRDRVDRKYRMYITIDNLVALQPNLHQEAEHLPLHYDTPRNEGFGVVIVTIGMKGNADIVIVDDGDVGQSQKSFRFHVNEGDMYILSGHARNKCLHGVLSRDCKFRESLNLRFGIHTKQFARSEIDRHWGW